MYYYFPNFASMKMPKVLNYFPPKTVKCLNWEYINAETKIIKENKQKPTPLNYFH